MERRAFVIRGIVQGVGFRPFVFNLATRLHLHGFIRNQAGSVLIEIEGEPSRLDCFLKELTAQPPPLAEIKQLAWEKRPLRGDAYFHIEASENGPSSSIYVSPDVAPCHACLAELFDPDDRHFGYPFLNCTHCGPRLTVITGVPYDRAQTTLASFVMCPACRREYGDPADRRFHAQPTACPACGPRLELRNAQGESITVADPLTDFVAALRAGQIGALKGLGGYHLVCDARNEAAVRALRCRKHRDEKPFALMVGTLAAAKKLCEVNAIEQELLQSARRPIVLLARHSYAAIAEEVAPRNPCLGVMLPYTPLHHLLMHRLDGMPLVMTSGNRSDEPIVHLDDEARTRLAGIADLFLVHNRAIHVRCDDSVTRIVDGQEMPLRRSRGYAPRPIALPFACPVPLLALGGQLKVTFALGRDRQAILSHHLGDLDHYEAFQAFIKDVVLYQDLFGIQARCLVHDLHPDYISTRYALAFSQRTGVKLFGVQHHHAHLASCMAEHGLVRPVIGVTFDGTGYGTDGAVWGGEFLIGDYGHCRRAAHLRYVGMPGGAQAIRQPWRMAVAHLADAGVESPLLPARTGPLEMQTIQTLLKRRLNTPLTSSMGRLFDAVASLAGVRDRVSYEGQAAVELEWLAARFAPADSYPFSIETIPVADAAEPNLLVDTRPLIAAVAAEANRRAEPARIARRFHTTVVEIIAQVCGLLRQATGLADVVLSGGVFLNALLTRETSARLRADGFRVYRHRQVPPNDGGLSLGQLAIAAQQLTPGGS